MIDPHVLTFLRCPENRSRLSQASPALLGRLNQAIHEKTLKNKVGRAIESPLDGALVREDHAVAYPIVDGIPVLLVDEGIPLAQVQ